MKIMTKTSYDAICDIVMSQKRLIEKKEAEIKMLKAQVERLSKIVEDELTKDGPEAMEDRACYEYMMRKQNLSSIYGSTAGKIIDFPNSHVHSEKKSPDDKLF